MSGKIVKSFNVTKTAEGDKSGLWTTVIAVAVFVTVVEPDEGPPPVPPKQ